MPGVRGPAKVPMTAWPHNRAFSSSDSNHESRKSLALPVRISISLNRSCFRARARRAARSIPSRSRGRDEAGFGGVIIRSGSTNSASRLRVRSYSSYRSASRAENLRIASRVLA